MVLGPAAATFATAKNAAYVGKIVSEAADAASRGGVLTSQLLTQLQQEVASRTIYEFGGSKVAYDEDTFAPSPIYSNINNVVVSTSI